MNFRVLGLGYAECEVGVSGGKDLEMVFSMIALNSGSHQRPSTITTARGRNPGVWGMVTLHS